MVFQPGNFASQRRPGHVQLETFWLSHRREGKLLASSELKLDTLLNTLQCTEQDYTERWHLCPGGKKPKMYFKTI